jgi:hypothetical protein
LEQHWSAAVLMHFLVVGSHTSTVQGLPSLHSASLLQHPHPTGWWMHWFSTHLSNVHGLLSSQPRVQQLGMGVHWHLEGEALGSRVPLGTHTSAVQSLPSSQSASQSQQALGSGFLMGSKMGHFTGLSQS